MNKSDINFIAFNMFLAKSEFKDTGKNEKPPHSGNQISIWLILLGYCISLIGIPGILYGLILSNWKIRKDGRKSFYYDNPSRKKLETIAGLGLIIAIIYFFKWLVN